MNRLHWTIAIATIALGTWSAEAGESGQPEAAPNPPTAASQAAPLPQNGAAPSAPQPSLPPASQPAPQPPVPGKGTPALVLDTDDYEGILGRSVRAADGDDLGRIIDVILDKEGRTRAAIIDFGGFLGVGSRKIAVDWSVLKFTLDGKLGPVTLQLSRNQVRVSPEYKSGEPIVVLGAASPGAAPVTEADQAPPVPAAAAPDKPTEKPATEKPADKPAEKTPD